MTVEVDQSGKIERTSKPTVLAYANGLNYCVFFSSANKRKALLILRKQGYSSKIIYLGLFCSLLFILFERGRLKNADVLVDTEYCGKEANIINLLEKQILLKNKLSLSLLF